MNTLGQVLKEFREKARKTLREVQETTGISNAYLSQLENGKINRPSANVLYQLSNEYEVELDVLLEAANIIEKRKTPSRQSELQRKISFYADKFSQEEENEIMDFIEYLRYKNKNAGPSHQE